MEKKRKNFVVLKKQVIFALFSINSVNMKSLLTLRKSIMYLLGGLALCMGQMYAQNVTHTARAHMIVSDGGIGEVGNAIKTKMLNSTFPVTIQLKGSRLCVTSKYVQLLPVYTDKGVFYGMFRLNKGTNWISGLPKGVYYVNNRKISIP